MKKSLKILIVLFAVAALLAYGVYWAFFDIQRIEGQQQLGSVDSPDGRYTVISYLNNGGATVDYAVLCAVRDNQTGKQRNIYWQYESQTAAISWIDERTVSINGIRLDAAKDTYDYRRK